MMTYQFRLLLTALLAFAAASLSASDPGSGDWPMWGGTPDRNMVSSMKGLPTDWDVKTKKKVRNGTCIGMPKSLGFQM